MSKSKYKFVTLYNHPLFPGQQQVKRSRLVMAESSGRCLLRTELVHHKNENTMDDRRKNLEIMIHGKHTSYHGWGRVHNVETKQRMSLNNKRAMEGEHHTVKSRNKISLALKGKHPTVETRKKLSLNHKGFKGKHHTIETKHKMSLTLRGRPGTMLGKYHTAETKYKMSLGQKDRRLRQTFPGI